MSRTITYDNENTEDRAARLVAEHILETVREDDDEPLTQEWADSEENKKKIGLRVHEDGSARWHGWAVMQCKTRGDARRLRAALGVELAEQHLPSST